MKTSLLQGKGYSMPTKQENRRYVSQKKAKKTPNQNLKIHVLKCNNFMMTFENTAFSHTFTTVTGQLLSIESMSQDLKNK